MTTWAAIGFFFTVFSVLVIGYMHAELKALRERIDGSRAELVVRVAALHSETVVRFDALNQRLDDLLGDGDERPKREETPTA